MCKNSYLWQLFISTRFEMYTLNGCDVKLKRQRLRFKFELLYTIYTLTVLHHGYILLDQIKVQLNHR